ncbi:MAG: DUF4783 domain-containing protein [Crocinitomicaceae bacterium]|nr:DUF4783 domain-containing protein [bacterium]MDG1351322.1 DUF4783 domain-containing protein [Crocinitomicaceae bacterium]
MAIVLFYFNILFLGAPLGADLPYVEISTAFEKNDAPRVISFCENPVLLILDNVEGIYNHAQAAMVLKDFFKSHPNGAFNYQFQGNEADEDIYSAAVYAQGAQKINIGIYFSSETPNRIQSIKLGE